MKTLYMAVEDKDVEKLTRANPVYRAIIARGSTYTKEQFRKWAVNTFVGARPNSSIAELAKACAKGGWRVIQMAIY